jgi:GNAT superfamily N-acetyltransferase
MEQNFSIRSLRIEDCLPISRAFALQGWHKPVEQYQAYYQEALEGSREVWIALVGEDFAGYLTIVWQSGYAPFRAAGIPEIVDFNVLMKYQRRGIGTALMDLAERRIATRSAVAGIGEGLTADYGAAQALYARRGYVPDGRGAQSHGRSIANGDLIPVDDDLALYLTRVLSG